MFGKLTRYVGARRRLSALRLPRASLHELQAAKLRRLLAHAYGTVPFYRKLFDAHGVHPDAVRGPEDLCRLPIVSKRDFLKADPHDLVSSAFNRQALVACETSGTTGEPFKFYQDRPYQQRTWSDCVRSHLLHGMKLPCRLLDVGGTENEFPVAKNPFGNFITRWCAVSSFWPHTKFLDFYNQYRPTIVRGYISTLYVFATWLEANALVPAHQPRFIITTSETVHDFMREKVAKAFGCRVIDRYSTAELGVVCDECEQGHGYHVFEDAVIPEPVAIDGQTYFVGTCLDNYATPFIRYNTRDVCEPIEDSGAACPCGLTTRRIGRFIGRENDFIKTPAGVALPPIILVHVTRSRYSHIKQYRFIQEDMDSVRLEAVLRKPFAPEETRAFARDVAAAFDGLRLDIVEVDSIPTDPGGKMRIVRSLV